MKRFKLNKMNQIHQNTGLPNGKYLSEVLSFFGDQKRTFDRIFSRQRRIEDKSVIRPLRL